MPSPPHQRRISRRQGSGSQILAAAVLFAIVLPLATWLFLENWWSGNAAGGPLTCRVQCATFLHEIAQEGTIECASNVEVRNEADAIGFHSTTVLEMVPEGTYVEPGDFLMRLDSSPLEELLVQRRIECNEREANLVKAVAAAETARIKLDEYINGLFPQSRQLLGNQFDTAQEGLRKAEQTLGFSESMYRQGFITRMSVEADRFSAERAKMNLKQAETKLTVLEKFTKKKELGTLNAELAVADATVRYRRHVHKLAVEELDHIAEQIDKCLVTAPAAGCVVYANYESRGERQIIEPGTMVWEHQLLFRLPNSNEMQVIVRIPEDKVALVQPGQDVRVRCEAFSEAELRGTVKRVSEFASPTDFWGSQAKVYETLILIDVASVKAAGVSLRPGLSAEVFIEVDRREKQLVLPFQAVLKHGKRHFCLTHDRSGFHPREIKIGASNGKFVVVREGLEADEQIVLAAANYREDVKLPD